MRSQDLVVQRQHGKAIVDGQRALQARARFVEPSTFRQIDRPVVVNRALLKIGGFAYALKQRER